MSTKQIAHHSLSSVIEAANTNTLRVTTIAIRGAAKLGLSRKDMLQIVASLNADDFYKSMTTYHDHKIWQDVYSPQVELDGQNYALYATISGSSAKAVLAELTLVSFKES